MNAAQAFIAFLKCEATQAEERAKSLRATAAAIEANAHEGRRKKRKRDPLKAQKKAHTAYTLYISENYEAFKRMNGPDLSSKDVLALIAQQWAQIDDQEKQAWQYKAEQLKEAGGESAVAMPQVAEAIEEVGLPEPPGTEDWGSKKRPARKAPPKNTEATASV